MAPTVLLDSCFTDFGAGIAAIHASIPDIEPTAAALRANSR